MRRWMMILAAVLGLALTAAAADPAHPERSVEAGHETAGDAHAAEAGHGPEHAEPQLLPAPGPAQLITAATTLVIFIVLLAVLS